MVILISFSLSSWMVVLLQSVSTAILQPQWFKVAAVNNVMLWGRLAFGSQAGYWHFRECMVMLE